jgi:hypothetical protein
MQWKVASLPTGTVRLAMASANSGWYATPATRQKQCVQYSTATSKDVLKWVGSACSSRHNLFHTAGTGSCFYVRVNWYCFKVAVHLARKSVEKRPLITNTTMEMEVSYYNRSSGS